MKKISLILMACAMIAVTSCGNNKKKAAQEAAPTTQEEFQIQQFEAHIQMQLDSIAAIFSAKAQDPFIGAAKEGKIVLTDSEKAIKPSYLIDPASVAELSTLAQRYRAIAMLSIDSEIAKLYEMPADAYIAAISKLAADINDSALSNFLKNSQDNISNEMSALYKEEVKNGRVCLFWELNGATSIESLYVLSQNIDKFTSTLTDDDAANLTYRLFLAKQSVDQLVAFYPELESLSKSLAPLDVLNAMDLAEFKSQLAEMKGQLEVIRNGLLK